MQDMNKKWMPIAAGIMGIIVGIFQVPFTIFGIYLIGVESGPLGTKENVYIAIMFLLALLAIVGGICHIFRKKWPLAIVGSAATSIILYLASAFFLLPGIAAIVLTVLSKKEFR